MTSFAISSDGTRIAYDRLGRGSAVVVIGGLFNDRTTMRPLAERLAEGCTVVNYDRRGRVRPLLGCRPSMQRHPESPSRS